jgi:hypothetical protein
MVVTRAEPTTRHDAEAEIQYIRHLLEPDGDRSLSPREEAPLRGRIDHLLEAWAGLPDV